MQQGTLKPVQSMLAGADFVIAINNAKPTSAFLSRARSSGADGGGGGGDDFFLVAARSEAECREWQGWFKMSFKPAGNT